MESLRKTQAEIKLEVKKSTNSLEVSLLSRPEDTEESIPVLKISKIEVMDSSAKEDANSKSIQAQNIQEMWETVKRPNL